MVMDETTFREHEEKEGWSDADEETTEDDQTSLSFSKFLILSFIIRTTLSSRPNKASLDVNPFLLSYVQWCHPQ